MNEADKKLCPLCAIGTMDDQVEIRDMTIEGHAVKVPMYFAVCNHCEIELAGEIHIDKNYEAVRIIRKSLGLIEGE